MPAICGQAISKDPSLGTAPEAWAYQLQQRILAAQAVALVAYQLMLDAHAASFPYLEERIKHDPTDKKLRQIHKRAQHSMQFMLPLVSFAAVQNLPASHMQQYLHLVQEALPAHQPAPDSHKLVLLLFLASMVRWGMMSKLSAAHGLELQAPPAVAKAQSEPGTEGNKGTTCSRHQLSSKQGKGQAQEPQPGAQPPTPGPAAGSGAGAGTGPGTDAAAAKRLPSVRLLFKVWAGRILHPGLWHREVITPL